MNAEEKKALVKRTMLAMLGGDLETAGAGLADDVRWIMAPSLSKSHPPLSSKREVLARNGASKALFPEGLKTEFSRIHCDGDTVVVEFTNQGKVANGKVYANTYCIVFDLNAEGRIKEIREYQDTLAVHQTFMS